MMVAVVIARTAGLDRILSGFEYRSFSRLSHLRRIALSRALPERDPNLPGRREPVRSWRGG